MRIYLIYETYTSSFTHALTFREYYKWQDTLVHFCIYNDKYRTNQNWTHTKKPKLNTQKIKTDRDVVFCRCLTKIGCMLVVCAANPECTCVYVCVSLCIYVFVYLRTNEAKASSLNFGMFSDRGWIIGLSTLHTHSLTHWLRMFKCVWYARIYTTYWDNSRHQMLFSMLFPHCVSPVRLHGVRSDAYLHVRTAWSALVCDNIRNNNKERTVLHVRVCVYGMCAKCSSECMWIVSVCVGVQQRGREAGSTNRHTHRTRHSNKKCMRKNEER